MVRSVGDIKNEEDGIKATCDYELEFKFLLSFLTKLTIAFHYLCLFQHEITHTLASGNAPKMFHHTVEQKYEAHLAASAGLKTSKSGMK